MKNQLSLALLTLALGFSSPAWSQDSRPASTPTSKPAAGKRLPAPMIAIPRALHPTDGVLSGGQPSKAQLHEAKKKGFVMVINLRSKRERAGFDEPATVKALGMKYLAIPMRGAADVTKTNMEALFAALAKAKGPVLLHCASGNRVGALFALKAKVKDGKSAAAALEIGRKAGMTRLTAAVKKILKGL